MIYVGHVVRFPATFRTAAGVATDPTTVTYRVLTPAGVETAYVYGTDEEVTRTAAGYYTLRLQLNEAGTWWVRVEGTGAVAAVNELERAVVVTASHMPSAEP